MREIKYNPNKNEIILERLKNAVGWVETVLKGEGDKGADMEMGDAV